MRKTIPLFISVFLCISVLHAQYFLGLRTSNYGGITNVNFNPAIADSRFKFDFNLLNVGFSAGNNYIGLDRQTFYNPSIFVNNFQSDYLHERLNGKSKAGYAGVQVQGPFSFMFSFGKKNKNALAVAYHGNMVTNVDGLDEPLAQIIYYGAGDRANSLFRKNFADNHVGVRSMLWTDYGLTYSRVLVDKEHHMFKAGATIKLLQGLGAAYLYADNLNYKWTNGDTLSITNSYFAYGHSDNLDFTNGSNFRYNFSYASPTIGGDISVVYEWRPDKDKYKIEKEERIWYRRDKNLYKLQFGFSVTDIGSIRFKKSPDSQNFLADIRDWDLSDFQAPDGLKSIDDTIQSRFLPGTAENTFSLWLPTRFNIWVDYQLGKGVGISGLASLSPNMYAAKNQVHHVSTYTINLHYDHVWFGAYLPFSYDANRNYNLGLTLRLGPLTVGTQDLLCLFAKRWIYNTDVHCALKIPVPYGKRTR